MKVARINETVNVTSRAFQESAHAIIDLHHRQTPFVIPVSHLLRVEKHRGFAQEERARDRQHVRRFHASHCDRGPQIDIHRQNAHNTVVRTVSLSAPHVRSFSSQVERQRPAPPRRPPITLPGKPLIPRPTPSTLASLEDDVLASIPATTRTELRRQETAQKDQLRKRQNKEDSQDTPWFKIAAALETQLKLCATVIEAVATTSRTYKDDIQEEADRFYKLFELKVLSLEERIHKFDNSYAAWAAGWAADCESGLAEARREGNRDWKTNEYLKGKGIISLGAEIEDLAMKVDASKWDALEVYYKRDWIQWMWERIQLQTEEALQGSQSLKDMKSYQSQSTRVMNQLMDVSGEVDKVLDNLDIKLMGQRHVMSRSQAENYLGIFMIAQDLRSLNDNLVPLGHYWRKLDLYALIDSRYPQLIDHVGVEIQFRSIFYNVKVGLREINVVFNILARQRLGAPTMRTTTYLQMRIIFRRYNEMFVMIGDQYLDLLQNGLTMLNSALDTELGRLKYAVLRPFNMYTSALAETQTVLRKNLADLDVMKRTNIYAKSPKSAKDIKWSGDLVNTYTSALHFIKTYQRELLTAITVVSYQELSWLSVTTGGRYRLKSMSRESENAEIQWEQRRALDNLSSLAAYCDHSYPQRSADPLHMRGQGELYPKGLSYPVELVSSMHGFFEVLQELLQESVVGFDVFQEGSFVSIATTEKVVVMDWGMWTGSGITPRGLNEILLTRLLEDPKILKIIHNIDTLQQYSLPRNIMPQNVVSLTRSQTGNRAASVVRKVSTGRWAPSIRTSEKESVMSFTTDLAFLSAYNLWTFLRNVPSMSLSEVEHITRMNILQAREKFLHKTAMAEHDGAIELGPLNVVPAGPFTGLSTRFRSDPQGPMAIIQLARLAAGVEVTARSNSERLSKRMLSFNKKRRVDEFAAFYLFTSMRKDLAFIGAALDKRNPARDILALVDELNLTLHANDRVKLELAEKVTSDLLSSATPSIKSRTSKVSPESAVFKIDEARSPDEQPSSGLQTQKVRLQNRAMPIEKIIATKNPESFPKQSPDRSVKTDPDNDASNDQMAFSNTFPPIFSSKSNLEMPAEPSGTGSKKSRRAMRRENFRRQKETGESPIRARRVVAKSTIAGQVSATRKTKKEKNPLRLVLSTLKIESTSIQNVLTEPKHKTVGEIAKLPTQNNLSGVDKNDLTKNDDKEELQREPARVPTRQRSSVVSPSTGKKIPRRRPVLRSVLKVDPSISPTSGEVSESTGEEKTKPTSLIGHVSNEDKAKPSTLLNRVRVAERDKEDQPKL